MKTVSAIALGVLILAPAAWSQTYSPAAKRFEQLDANGDGKLSPAEVGTRRIFRVAVSDGDGFISLAEFEAANRNRPDLPAGRPVPADAPFVETKHTLTVDGRERTFVVQVPKDPRNPLPVVFFFHGGGGRGENMAAFGFREMVARENFLAVYPTGWKNNWNDGRIIPTQDMLELYLKRNGITGAPTEELLPDTDPDDGCRTLVRRYPPGKDGVKVEYWLIQGGGHTLPGARRAQTAVGELLVGKTSRDFDGLEVIWNFFKSCPPRQSGTP